MLVFFFPDPRHITDSNQLVPWLTSHLLKSFGPAGAKAIFYINLLGVDPALSGKGLGKALLQHVLEVVDEQNVAAGLFTQLEKNVRFYEKNGFQVTVEEEIDLRGKVVPSWGMVRPPKQSPVS
jgi:GNAT superfamily N-acetyltransferase